MMRPYVNAPAIANECFLLKNFVGPMGRTPADGATATNVNVTSLQQDGRLSPTKADSVGWNDKGSPASNTSTTCLTKIGWLCTKHRTGYAQSAQCRLTFDRPLTMITTAATLLPHAVSAYAAYYTLNAMSA